MSDVKETEVAEEDGQPTPQEGADSKQTTADGKGKTSDELTPEEEVEELDLSDIKKTKDGFEYRDPDNPEKTLYRGKTVAEVIRNIAKGNAEKDKFIAKLKAEGINGRGFANRNVKGDAADDPALAFPKPQEILLATAKEYGLDPVILQWSKTDWREFESEHGTRETMNLVNLEKQVRDQAGAQVTTENVRVMNNAMLFEEEQQVRDLVEEAGVDVDAVNWDTVFDEATSNPKNYNRAGIRRSGSVVKRAAAEIAKVLKETAKKQVTKEIEDDMAAGKRKARKVASPGGQGPTNPTSSTKDAPKNTNDAYERALAAFK